MGKVISIRDKMEQWATSFSDGGVNVGVSSHGRMRIQVGNEVRFLTMMESVDFLSRVSKAMELELHDLYEEA